MKRILPVSYVIPFLFLFFAIPAAGGSAPPAVKGLKVEPHGGGLRLTWCKPVKDKNLNLYYEIYRKAKNTPVTETEIVPRNRIAVFGTEGACLSYDDFTVRKGHTYSYAVIVVSKKGARSGISKSRNAEKAIASVP